MQLSNKLFLYSLCLSTILFYGCDGHLEKIHIKAKDPTYTKLKLSSNKKIKVGKDFRIKNLIHHLEEKFNIYMDDAYGGWKHPKYSHFGMKIKYHQSKYWEVLLYDFPRMQRSDISVDIEEEIRKYTISLKNQDGN